MKHSEAFDIILAEFSEDMATVRVRKPNSFIAVASGGEEYFVRAIWQWPARKSVRIVADDGDRVIHNGQWAPIERAAYAARAAVSAICGERTTHNDEASAVRGLE